MFSEVMALAGKKISDMPKLPNYRNGDRNGLCFNWLGGCCHFDPCAQLAGHIPKEEVTDDLVDDLVNLLKPGVEKMLRGERAPGRKKKPRK